MCKNAVPTRIQTHVHTHVHSLHVHVHYYEYTHKIMLSDLFLWPRGVSFDRLMFSSSSFVAEEGRAEETKWMTRLGVVVAELG